MSEKYKKATLDFVCASVKTNVERRAAVVLALELEYEHQLLIARRRLPQRLRRRRRARRWRVRPRLAPARRLEYGHYNRLLQERRVEDENAFMNYVKMFALPLPLPVYLGFLGIPVILQKCAVMTNLFAVNYVK